MSCSFSREFKSPSHRTMLSGRNSGKKMTDTSCSSIFSAPANDKSYFKKPLNPPNAKQMASKLQPRSASWVYYLANGSPSQAKPCILLPCLSSEASPLTRAGWGGWLGGWDPAGKTAGGHRCRGSLGCTAQIPVSGLSSGHSPHK